MIALICTTHGSGHGAEVVLSELVGAWRDGSLPIAVVAPEGSAGASAASEARIPWIPLRSSRDALFTNLIAAHAAVPALRGCRLAHSWNSRGLELSWWIGRRLGVPATATLHDHPESPAQTPARRRLWRAAVNLQDAIAFPSAALERAWRAAGLTRASRVALNGMKDLAPRRRERGPGQLVIGFLGMYTPWKGFTIAQAWARAGWPEGVRWAFYGDHHRALARQAAALASDLGPRVRFEGPQPRERIFAEVDILVHCSTTFDPLPTVLIEAAQAAIPAVASTLGGAGEIVEHGATGFLFDPERPDDGLRHLRSLVGDADLRARLGIAARARYERLFRAERMADDYAGFWKAVLSGALTAPD